MKKIFIVVVVMLFVAGVAFAQIAGSKHDLSSAAQGYSGGALSACNYCHTPHHSNTAVGTAPLWNRTNPSSTSYKVYGGNGTAGSNGTTMSGTTVSMPGAHSLTCLSCHDGTIEVGDVYNGGTQFDSTVAKAGVLTSGMIDAGANGYIGTDLRTTHPIGVVYYSTTTKPSSLAGLTSSMAKVDSACGSGCDQYINGKKWKIYGGGDGVGQVDCGSCHDPHATGGGQDPFLKDQLTTICTDCHANK